MTYLVSPCCGYQYSDYVDDEGYESYVCDHPKCGEEFSEPLEDYEYDARMRESYLEMMADERRDLGL